MTATSTASSKNLVSHPFHKPTHTYDIVFIVQGKKLHFNKSVLSLCSPVFQVMFNGDFAEKKADRIPLPGKRYEDMVEFFKHIHPVYAAATEVKDGTLKSLLELSREYQVEHIRDKCRQFVCHQADTGSLSADRLLYYIWIFNQFDIMDHRPQLVNLAADKTSTELTSSGAYQNFTTNALTDVLLARVRTLERRIGIIFR